MGLDLSKFGEGFWVTMAFMFLCTLILCVAMITGNEIATTVAAAIIAVLAAIAAFWFPTRGQTSP